MTAEVALRPTETWSLPFLSTGELGISRKLAEAGIEVMAGQSVRLIEVAADGRAHGAFDTLHETADGAAFADLLKSRTARLHGTAGPAFVRALFADLDAGLARVAAVAEEFTALLRPQLGPDPDGQILRVLKRCGHVAAAGELATHFGITGWPKGAAVAALRSVLEDWLDARDDGAVTMAGPHLLALRIWLEKHWPRIEDLDAKAPVTAAAAGWRKGGWVMIPASSWSDIHLPAQLLEAARALACAGILEGGDGRNMTSKAPRGVPGRPRIYKVKLARIFPDGIAKLPAGETPTDLAA